MSKRFAIFILAIHIPALVAEIPTCNSKGEKVCEADHVVSVDVKLADMGIDEFGVQLVQTRSTSKRFESKAVGADDKDERIGKADEVVKVDEAAQAAASGDTATAADDDKTTAASGDTTTDADDDTTTAAGGDTTTAASGYTCALLDAEFWYNPYETDRSYSSVYENQPPGVGNARSMLDSVQGWSCGTASATGACYLVMDMGRETQIKGTLIQGRKDNSERVAGYRAEYSSDNVTYTEIDQSLGTNDETRGRSKWAHIFSSPVTARYLKIVATNVVKWPSMRAGAILVENTGAMMERVNQDLDRKWNEPPDQCTPIYYDPCEQARSYSGVFQGDAPGIGHAQSMLSSPKGFAADSVKTGHWLTMDLGGPMWAMGVITAGRADRAWEYTKEFWTTVSVNGNKWYGHHICDSGQSYRECLWLQPSRVRYIKLVIEKFNAWPALRVGTILCGMPGKEIAAATA